MADNNKKDNKKIENFKEFHRLLPEMIKKINNDQQLAMRAAVNPLLAFEELGYELPDDVQKTIERFVRFPSKERKRLVELEAEIHQIAGRTFDLDSPEDLESVLFNTLKIHKPKDMEKLAVVDIIKKGAMRINTTKIMKNKIEKKKIEEKDPLEILKDKHSVIGPLLAYRKIQTASPGFAPRSLYEELKQGKRKFPISSIKVRFPEDHKHEEVENA